MAVKIYSSFNTGGMPTLEYSIAINGVSINLSKEDFEALTNELGHEISKDLKKAEEVNEKYWNNVKKLQELRRDIISIFWDGGEDLDDYLFRKTVKEIEQEKLFETLEKYNKFLGFE